MNYVEFLERKSHSSAEHGFDPVYMPDFLFDFQAFIVEKALRKGRCANFIDTGLGKTAMLLVIADNIVRKTNKRVIILTPLAVAFQFVNEAERFGIPDVEYSKDGKYKGRIVITNYERLHHFSPSDFEAVLLDESSILKNFEGAIKHQCTSFIKKVRYRQLGTASPSPNDFIELGTSSEALGYMGYTDMLGKFFTNNEGTIKPQDIGTKWVLKGHAVDKFFAWVSSWSISARKPSDLGFSDEKHILPQLRVNNHVVQNDQNLVVDGQIQLFNQIARRLTEVRCENKLTLEKRCEKAVTLTGGNDFSVYWCNLNNEGDLLEELDPGAVQIKGSMNIDKKEELLIAFAKGEIKRLITKPKITAFGLNWQHCAHTVYFPTFSYEQYYQAIRRFWRFGQKREVVVDLVYSDGQQRVLDALVAKTAKADELFHKLNISINTTHTPAIKHFDKNVTLPNFLKN
jgi:hypothetical protein